MMPSIDLRSILLGGIFTVFICTLLMVALWRQNRQRFAGLALLAADFILQTLGMVLILLRGSIPDWMSIMVSNTAVVSGALLGYEGLERFVGKRGRLWPKLALLVVFVLIHAHFTFVDNHLLPRNLNVAMAILLISLQCVWVLLVRLEPAGRPQTRMVAMVFMLYAAAFLYRIVFLLTRPGHTNDYLQSGANEAVFHIVWQIQFILLTYAAALMVNRCLLDEREKAFSEIKVLSGLLPICAWCKKIRDDKGYWNQIESYIDSHSEAEFSHSICPECMEKMYSDHKEHTP